MNTAHRENWTLEVTTHTRDELIDVSRVLINGFDPAFFQNPDDVPHIAVGGAHAGGKTVAIEAMMKSLLDEYNPEDMKDSGAPQRGFFLESTPNEALSKYCLTIGSTRGAQAMYSFDRITPQPSTQPTPHKTRFRRFEGKGVIAAFQEAAHKHGVLPVGAIFKRIYRNNSSMAGYSP